VDSDIKRSTTEQISCIRQILDQKCEPMFQLGGNHCIIFSEFLGTLEINQPD
jgi:hypothetical protein